jgi:alpha-1,6-mannosyltransferase
VCAVVAAHGRGSPLPAGAVERTDVWSVVFLTAAGAAFVLYLLALLLLRRRDLLRLTCALALIVQLVPLAGPLLLSQDAYSYWAYGRIVTAHDGDPYTTAPARFPGDPATNAVAPGWRSATSVYGPAFTTASAGVADVAGRSREAASLLFRAAAALAVVAAALLAARLSRRKSFAVAFVGWNPLLALQFGGGGHNDALMIAGVLGASVLAERGRDAAAGSVWILAAAVKSPALALLPLRLVRARRGLWLGAAAAAGALSVAATVAFGSAWLSAFRLLGHREARFSLPARLAHLGVTHEVGLTIARVVLVAGSLWLAREAIRGRPRLALGACLLLLTSPWVLPWYAMWPVGLAAAEDDGLAQILALGIAAYLLPDRVPL